MYCILCHKKEGGRVWTLLVTGKISYSLLYHESEEGTYRTCTYQEQMFNIISSRFEEILG